MAIQYSIEKNKTDSREYAVVTGYDGKINDLIIPSEIEELPVEAIGNHAFFGREDLCSVSIPENVRTLYGFAFHNCRNLKKISLHDSIDDYYDGVCRQCDSLSEIEITVSHSWYEVVRNFLADNDKTLRFRLNINDGRHGTAMLTFPEYVYDFAENTMARTIQFSIDGSGYAYRECVDRRSINYREYDRLFGRAVIDGNAVSEDIAIGRLLFPYELDDEYRMLYEDYIIKNERSILERLIYEYDKGNNVSSENVIKGLISYKADGRSLISDDGVDYATALTTKQGLTALSAMLVAGRRTSGNGNRVLSF